MTDSMIERVARAAYFAGEDIEDPFNPIRDAHWAYWWEQDRKMHEAIGRAAIKAMREPTEGMKIAGLLAGSEANSPAVERHKMAGGDAWIMAEIVGGDGRIYDAAWRGAIDEALK